jgi:aryl-alcohol dehydrogenase-like predicted oxidoreductase
MNYYQSPAGLKLRPWAFNEEDGRAFIRAALERGVNFFDVANVYSDGECENVVGGALRDFARRDEIVIATKVGLRAFPGPNGAGLSRKAIFSEIDKSLKRLGTDYVDLYIIHRFDYATPLEESLEALNDVVRSGRARYLGASSMHAWRLMKALGLQRARGWSPFITMQNYYNMLYREEEREMLPLCASEGVAVTPWSPLARGRLARPWSDDPKTERAKVDGEVSERLFAKSEHLDKPVVDRLMEVAAGRGTPPAQVALAWMYRKPGIVAPVVGASSLRHIDDAVAALSITLSDEEMRRLEEPYQPHPPTKAFV